MQPAKIALVPDEPPLPENPKRRGESESGAPSWFEQQDLSVLKAWNNEIVELQPEISLFGSLQNVDVRSPFLRSTCSKLTAALSAAQQPPDHPA